MDFFPEQYSWPHRTAVARGINHRIVFYYQKYIQQPFPLDWGDLKSCFYLIVHSTNSLALKCVGITFLGIIIMLDTIKRMPHMFRKVYGSSNLMCGGDTTPDKFRHLIMGLCQVNGCAPQLWSIISSIVLSALWTQGFVIHFVNYFTAKISQLIGFSSVDDCDTIQSDDDIESIQ